MPHYDVVLVLEPPRLFGLPEEGLTVFEAAPGQVYSPAIDSRTGYIVGHGTLSRYRDYDARLRATFALNAVQVEVDDNFLHVTLTADDPESAVGVIHRELARLCAFASTFVGNFLSFHILQVVEDGIHVPLTESMSVLTVHAYNVDWFREKLLEASSLLDRLTPDQRLDQALRYFADAGTLYRLMTEDGLERLLMPSCFLQFWKALATIVGDPSSDRDLQSRYRKLGLGTGNKEYYRQVLQPLHSIRDQFDVAHIASLNAPVFVTLGDVDRCRSVAVNAIQAYVVCLGQTRTI